MQHGCENSLKFALNKFGYVGICPVYLFYKLKYTEMKRFKQSVLDVMLRDPELFGAIAKVKGVSPTSLAVIIRRNGFAINQYSVYELVAAKMGCTIDDLLETKLQKEAA